MRTHTTTAGAAEATVATRASVDISLRHLRATALDRPAWISALHTSVASNRTATLHRVASAIHAIASVFDTPVVTGTSPFNGASSDAVSVTSSDAGRTVTVATIVTTVPTVVHANVLSMRGVEVFAVAVIIAVSTYSMPGMSTMIGVIKMRTSEVEVVTVRVTGIDAEVPIASVPVQRTIEIGSCDEGIPLPVKQDIAQIEIAALPIGAIHIVTAGDTHQIVKIDLVGSLVLFVSEIQLISHLVSQEQGLVASLLIAHCICRDGCCQHHHHCEKHLFHTHIF